MVEEAEPTSRWEHRRRANDVNVCLSDSSANYGRPAILRGTKTKMKITLTAYDESGPKARWIVRYYENRRPIRRIFKSKIDALQFARTLRLHELLKPGNDFDQIAAIRNLLDLAGADATRVIRAGLAALQRGHPKKALPTSTFADGAKKVIERATRISSRTRIEYRSIYASLCKTFGHRIAIKISSEEVQKYFDELHGNGNQSISPYTKKRRLLLFRMALRELGIRDPLPSVWIPIPESCEARFFTIPEVQLILRTARVHERGMVALALFGAIRPSTLERLSAESVNTKERVISIPGAVTKTRYRQILDTNSNYANNERLPGPPPLLWNWLEHYPFVPCSWSRLLARLRSALGFWIQNGLRNTGAANYRAIYGCMATAHLLGVGYPIEQKFAGIVSRQNAEEFYRIEPESASDLDSTGS
jgi:hypothetical protein